MVKEKKTKAPAPKKAKETSKTVTTVIEKKKEPIKAISKNGSDFDWDKEEDVITYTESERKKLEELYSSTLNPITRNEIVKGSVVDITEKDVVLNIGFKSDGLVGLSEFREDPALKVGDEVEVFVVTEEDPKGQLILSRKNAKLIRAWEDIVTAHEKGEIVQGKVICRTKGGLVVNLYGFETFLPGSQIDVKPIIDYDYYVGKTMEFKIVKINEAIKNAVVSHKALIESELETQRHEIISKLEKGQVLEGTVKNITDFGAFIDLGGVDGLLYLSDISWGRISHPNKVLKLNQKINVAVLDFNDDKKRISLGLKQLQPHPWDTLDAKIKEGVKVKGKVVNIEDYGVFLEIVPGIEGLVHVSEISWSLMPVNPKEYFKLGEEFEAKVVTIERENRKMSLSIKQMTPDPWIDIDTKYAMASKHKGKVVNLTPYGAFIELAHGIGGLIHISDFSWTKKISHPSEVTKIEDELDVVVLKIDKEDRRLSLGHKQIEKDPWDTFEEKFSLRSIHQGQVLKIGNKDAIILLSPYGLEAVTFSKNLKKEDGSTPEINEALDFIITQFDKVKRKVTVSLASEDDKNTEVTEHSKKKPSNIKKKFTHKKPYKTKSFGEKNTLGDIEALSKLKDELQNTQELSKEQKAEKPQEKEKIVEKVIKETTVSSKEDREKEKKKEVKKSSTPIKDKKETVDKKAKPKTKSKVEKKPAKK